MRIRWAEPPAANPGRVKAPRQQKHAEFAAALRQRPGAWAIFSDAAGNSTAASIKRGKLGAFAPAGAYEAVGRKMEDTPPGRVRVFVRFVGQQS